MKALQDIFTPEVRKWIYNVVAAVIPLLIIFDILTPEIGTQWLLVAAAVLGLGTNMLASSNVTVKDKTADYRG